MDSKVLLVLSALLLASASAQLPPINLDTGNALTDALIPKIIPVVLQYIQQGDASLLLRVPTLVTHASFDAIAPYHATAVGVSSNIPRRPSVERTTRNRNIAVIYASYRACLSLYPLSAPAFRQIVIDAGLDPNNNSQDLTTAIGIGNYAGNAAVADRIRDGMNQLGDEGGVEFNRFPYADYTGYVPSNTPFKLKNPDRWQPNLSSNRFNGIFTAQQFVTPQLGRVRPYFLKDVSRRRAPRPTATTAFTAPGYKAQVDEVLAASAALNDTTKSLAVFFNSKFDSLGFGAVFAAMSKGKGDIESLVIYDFLTNVAMFDSSIVTWKEKAFYDAVRPFSAVRYVYGSRRVTAWGGVGRGTQSLPANQWKSFLNVADHPEYPSGSACFCAAFAQSSRRFFNSDVFGFSVTFPAGSNPVEPGIVPSQDVTVTFPTFTRFQELCQESRVDSGVHFRAAVNAGAALCAPIGDAAFDFVQSKLRPK